MRTMGRVLARIRNGSEIESRLCCALREASPSAAAWRRKAAPHLAPSGPRCCSSARRKPMPISLDMAGNFASGD